MSYPVIDYLPFDYESYLHEILPLWEQALAGKVQPLKQRIQAATHFSLWPRINCPLTIKTELVEKLFGNDLEPLREWSYPEFGGSEKRNLRQEDQKDFRAWSK